MTCPFEAALDDNPADWDTRLVYADWLESQGELPCGDCNGSGRLPGTLHKPAEFCDCPTCNGTGRIDASILAAGQRWQAEHRKRPFNSETTQWHPWHWWSRSNDTFCVDELCVAIGLDDGGGVWKRFPTRQAAEMALAFALEASWTVNS